MITPLTELLNIKYPIILAPMFLVSNEEMSIEAIKAGIAPCIPALNWRKDEQMRAGMKGYLVRLTESLPKCKSLFFTTDADEERLRSYLDEFYPNIRLLDLSEEA